MSFYLKSPKGLANVNSLEDCARQRVKCYENLYTENIRAVILELECLIEDSILDRLGHFLFRLAALKSGRFLDIFIRNEIKLLDVRLSCYEQEDVKYFIRKLRKHSTECLQSVEVEGKAKDIFTVLIQVCTRMLQTGFFKHGFENHSEVCSGCQQYQIEVPFQLCPDLVAAREYDISKGLLQTHCFQWKNLILSLFKTFLLQTLKEMKYSPRIHYAFQDDRIKNVVILIKYMFFKNSPDMTESKQGTLKLESIFQESPKFPLCMQNLYGILQKNNRLGHNARFDFSLFLKGIGLSIGDALTFWENSYSKQHASCSKCTHTWQENEKRYVYGIRHLYGLEGSRKSYGVKSCHQIQGTTLGANEEGGCPFKHFDDANLRKVLKSCLPASSHDHVEVIIYERKDSAKKACELFSAEQLKKVFEKKSDSEVACQDPAQYYLLMKNLVS